MFTSTRAESFAGIIVWVFILGFVLLWIVQLLIFMTDTSTSYTEQNRIENLRKNIYEVLEKFDLENISSWEEIFIHKDTLWWIFRILTGSMNSSYQYVDEFWNHIPDINNYDDSIYILKWIVYKKDSFFGSQDTIYSVDVQAYNP